MKLSPWLYRTRKKPRPIKSDPQRHLIYQMEREWIGNILYTTAKVEHLQSVLNHACRTYKVSRPKLTITRGGSSVEVGYCTDTEIALSQNGDGVNLPTLLHELAHWIAWEYHGAVENHGPEFAGLYAELLDRYRVLPIDAFDTLRKRWKIRVTYPCEAQRKTGS